ncbi:GNAT family N-acetyltransferase [Amphibiibacter pelophylacis]|uniref:GNAT family N-acetyltransferase n=1 Tax=Amphibiibacter pelophylacis TaxID=1799477 RepID=A0ACC6P2Z5_9BURK
MKHGYRLVPARDDDFEALMGLRWCAMRESMADMGRIDPDHARARMSRGFAPQHTHKILADTINPLTGQPDLMGFVVVLPSEPGWIIDHLYIHPTGQRRGLGSWVLGQILEHADRRQRSVSVVALRHSAAVRFYERHGFVATLQGEWDVHMQRAPRQPALADGPEAVAVRPAPLSRPAPAVVPDRQPALKR